MCRPFILQWCLGLSLAAAAASLGCQGQIGGDPVAPKTSNTGSGGNGNSTSSTGGSSPGTGGASSPGTGGTISPGTGGSTSPGTGGTTSSGTGGATSPGTGGTTSPGTGGTTSPGTGGSGPSGTGGSTSTGMGGSSPTGTGGASSSGSGGSGPSGTGGQGGAPPDPFAVAPTCTSNTTWKGGNEGSGNMNPGMACISCHKSSGGEAPSFSVAGTLYPTAHEPDLCNGASGSAGAQIIITGADGKTLTLTPNSAGNFYSSTSVALPYQAKVLYKGQERAMVETQSTGDCNSCHTQNGASGAPGRILLP